MSNNIDERIVEMRFDNQKFEKNIETSTKSLEKLKSSLNFEESAKSLHGFEKVVNSFSLSGIEKGIDALSHKFSTLGIIGITAIQNITNTALNAGKRIISALTVDPVKSGLAEYETKMGAITTILTNTASKGTTLDEVNAALNELNTYADQTIYNFSEMTRNIGTFTAAGIGLKESTEAIKGIANLAAGSGSNAQQASTAMYQLSQALASGKMQLMDWNSVVNAGMGGELFKSALIDTAKGLGIATPAMKDFRDSLKDGWITSEVLIQTLQRFAKDDSLLKAATEVKTFTQLINTMKESMQSGWAQTWENILGNKNEAASFFTAINDAFSATAGASANARNEMLLFWKENEGRRYLLEGIANVLMGLADIMQPIEEAFREIFPAMTGQRLVAITKAFRDLTANFKIGEGTAENLKRTFKGVFAVLDIGRKTIGFLAKAVGLIIKAIAPGSSGLLEITANLGDFLSGLNEALDSSNFFGKALEKVGTVITFVVGAFKSAGKTLGPIFDYIGGILSSWAIAWRDAISETTFFSDVLTGIKDIFSNVGDKLASVFETIGAIFNKFNGTEIAYAATGVDELGDSVEKVDSGLTRVKDTISKVTNAIKNTLGPVIKFIADKLKGLTFQDVGAMLTGVGFLTFARALSNGIKSIDKVVSSFAGILKEVGNSLKAFQLQVKAKALLTVAISLGILAAALIAMSFIKIEDLVKSLGALTVVFIELVVGLKILNKGIKDAPKIAGKLLAIGASMLLLALSVKIMASLPLGKLSQGVGAIAALMGIITLFVKFTKDGDLAKSSAGMTSFAFGLVVLCGAIAILGNLPLEKLSQGVTTIAALLGMIVLFVQFTSEGDLAKSSAGMTSFAFGLVVLSGAIAILGNLPLEKLSQGVATIAALLGMIVAFVTYTKEGDLAKSSAGMTAFAFGLVVLCGAIAILGNLPLEKLSQGVATIAVLMAGITIFIRETSFGDMAKSSAGMIGFAFGLVILSGAISILGNLPLGNLVKGVSAIAALVAGIAVFINVTKEGDLATSAASMIGFSVGLIAMSIAVAILAAIPANKIIQGTVAIATLMLAIATFINLTRYGDLATSAAGLIGFAAGLSILAGVIAILSALNTNKLMMASAAIAILMVAIATFINVSNGKKLAVGAVGLIAFAVAIRIMAQALIPLANLDIGKTLAASGCIAIIMLAIAAFSKLTNGAQLIVTAAGLSVFAIAIGILATSLAALGSIDINTLLISAAALAGTFVILGLAAVILAPLSPVILALSGAIALLGVGMLAAGAGVALFAQGLTVLAKGGKPLMDTLLVSMRALISLIPLLAKKMGEGIVAFARAIRNGLPTILATFSEICAGLIQIMVKNIPPLVSAFVQMMLAILQTLADNIQPMVDAGMLIILGFLEGVSAHIQAVIEVAIQIVINFIEGVASKLPDIIQAGIDLMISFIDGVAEGIENNSDAVIEAGEKLMYALIEAMGKAALNSQEIGANITQGLIRGIGAGFGNVKKMAKDLGDAVYNSTADSLEVHSPSWRYDFIGRMCGDGLGNGLAEGAKKPIAASEKMSTDVMNAADSTGLSAFFREMANGITGTLTDSITDGSKNASGAMADTATETEKSGERIKTAFEKAVDAIEKAKYFDKMNLTEELAAWTKLQTQYAKGTEERERADREVYRIKKELRDKDYSDAIAKIDYLESRNKLSTQEELTALYALRREYKKGSKEWKELSDRIYKTKQEKRKEDFDNAVETIDDLKYYNKLSLTDELKMWEDIQKKYKKGDKERIQADKEVYRVKQEISEKMKQIDNDYYENCKSVNEKLTDDIKSVQDAYDDAVKSRTDSLYSSYGLFDKVEKKDAVSGTELLSNLDGQVQAFETWQDELNKLAEKGIGKGLYDELAAMGPQSLAEIQALNTLSAPQLETYVTLWQTKFHDAKEQATRELEPMRVETVNQIRELATAAGIELGKYKDVWTTQMAELTTVVNTQAAEFNADQVISIQKVGTEVTKEVTTITDDVKKIFKSQDWQSIGSNMILGIKKGVMSRSAELAAEMARTAKLALQSAKDALGIKSPSKEFEEVGEFADEGFAIGLRGASAMVSAEGANVGNAAINSLRSALSNMAGLIAGDMNMTPTIRPVLDLTEVTNGLNSTFDKPRSLSVMTADKVTTISNRMERQRTGFGDTTNQTTTSNVDSNITINNHYSVRNDQDIEKINIKLKNTLNRYNKARGVPV